MNTEKNKTKKPMPVSVKFLVIFHCLALFTFVSVVFIYVSGLYSNIHFNRVMSNMLNNPLLFSKLPLYSWIIFQVVLIYGFIKRKYYARNVSVVFYGLMIIYFSNYILQVFTIEAASGWTIAFLLFWVISLFTSVFLLYVGLRPEVYDYCRKSE